jgi:serine/threonine-protein kinase RsbT
MNAKAGTGIASRFLAGASSLVTLPLKSDEDVVAIRRVVREGGTEIKLSLVDLTKLVTAASELARNTIKYGGGGEVHVAKLQHGAETGFCMSFVDHGPGIEDIALAMQDGYTSGGGLGLGLGGTKRLVDEFDIQSQPGNGTTVTIIKWKK